MENKNPNSIKILVANDFPNDGMNVAQRLREYGFHAYSKPKDGNVILKSIAMETPDVVIMDINIPQVDSLSIIRRVRKTALNAPLFIITSSYENAAIEKRLLDNGASYFLLKPFDYIGLCDIINDIVQDNEQYITETLESVVTEIIHKVGVSTKIKGFHYLRTAIMSSYENKMFLKNITTKLYPEIASKYNTTKSRVERDIRHALTSAWKKGNPTALNQLLGHALEITDKRPTNSEFISLVTESLIMKYKYSPLEV